MNEFGQHVLGVQDFDNKVLSSKGSSKSVSAQGCFEVSVRASKGVEGLLVAYTTRYTTGRFT